MPLNLMTLTTLSGPVHVNPAQIVSVEPHDSGAKVTLANGVEWLVTDRAEQIVKTVNFRAPDGF